MMLSMEAIREIYWYVFGIDSQFSKCIILTYNALSVLVAAIRSVIPQRYLSLKNQHHLNMYFPLAAAWEAKM